MLGSDNNEGNNPVVTIAEAKLIARDAADAALDKQSKELPSLLKPVMYEVAESVAARTQRDFIGIFSKVMGADVLDDEHIRDIHKDLYWLRDQRVAKERRITMAFDNIIGSGTKWSVIAALSAAAAYLGVKLKGG